MRRKLLSAGISEFVELGSHLKNSERREAFARLSDESVNLVIGTRGAIFAPWAGIEEIVVVDDFSPHHYEIKSPYWNTRDVALLRSEIENSSIVFVGQSLSLELLRLVDSGWIPLISQANSFVRTRRHKVVTEPDSYRSTVEEGLKHGPVLISVVEKSYSNVFSCERCRTIAKCDCGGRIVIQKKGLFGCTICEKSSSNWACQECSYSKFRTIKIGAERIHDDIGRMFPGIPILISTAEKPVIDELAKQSIVVSTFGVEPDFSGGYGAIVLLGGEELINRPFIRSEEETLHRFFKLLGKLNPHGLIYSSLPAQNGISQAIIQQNPIKRLRAESHERHASNLPPHTRFVRIDGDALSMPGLRRKINDEFGEKLDSYISIDGTSITLKIQHQYSSEVLASLRALQKLRSLKKKALLGIHVDPYDI
jgi:primosomal protein N' (replication factor Y)